MKAIMLWKYFQEEKLPLEMCFELRVYILVSRNYLKKETNGDPAFETGVNMMEAQNETLLSDSSS